MLSIQWNLLSLLFASTSSSLHFTISYEVRLAVCCSTSQSATSWTPCETTITALLSSSAAPWPEDSATQEHLRSGSQLALGVACRGLLSWYVWVYVIWRWSPLEHSLQSHYVIKYFFICSDEKLLFSVGLTESYFSWLYSRNVTIKSNTTQTKTSLSLGVTQCPVESWANTTNANIPISTIWRH